MDINSFVIGYKKGKASGGGGGSLEGFHMVRFFNDDQTTLLYTVYVPTGASAMYAGETPVSTVNAEYILVGFEPSPANVTEDMDCYAVYTRFTSLNEATWEQIAQASAEGTAQNYFAVGDTKMVHIEGTVGTLAVNGDYGVYIIGFDHNEEIEGKGISFGTFKSAASNGIDLCLVDGAPQSENGTKYFNMNHYGASNYGGWAGCDMRYDILGSTDVPPSNYGAGAQSGRTGYNASETCATNPVANTLMAALPDDLRAVMKPMTIYSDNHGGGSPLSSYITATIDYLPLLSECEILGNAENLVYRYYQEQYAYFVEGNSKIKYENSLAETASFWWMRTANTGSGNYLGFRRISADGSSGEAFARVSLGIAPIFKV